MLSACHWEVGERVYCRWEWKYSACSLCPLIHIYLSYFLSPLPLCLTSVVPLWIVRCHCHCITSLFLMWCNDSESLADPATLAQLYQVPHYIEVSVMWFVQCHTVHTRHAFTRPETNTCYGNNLDNPWIVLLEECCQLQKYFILLKDFHECSVLCHSKYMCTSNSCRIVPLLHSPDAPLRVQTLIQAYMTAIRSSPGLCHPGESGHKEVCYQWSKASPLILFHVKQKGLNTAPDLKLWQWNIPGEKRDMLVWKGALRLPECFCLFIRLLKLLQPVLYCKQLCQTVSSLWVRFLQVLPVQR